MNAEQQANIESLVNENAKALFSAWSYLHLLQGMSIGLIFIFAAEIFDHQLNCVASAGGTSFDLKMIFHRHTAFLDEIRK